MSLSPAVRSTLDHWRGRHPSSHHPSPRPGPETWLLESAARQIGPDRSPMRFTSRLRRKILARHARVAVVGQGYVGLSVACAAAEAGFQVTGIDLDPLRV